MLLIQFDKELTNLSKRASKRNVQPYARLNGLSDQRIDKWKIDGTTLFERHPNIQFYDYTKRLDILDNARTIPNYHVTLSRSERNEQDLQHVKPNENIAVVFDQLPAQYHGRSVISGDDNDLRFTDPPGVVVGLSPKGKAKKDRTGFMVQTLTQIERN